MVELSIKARYGVHIRRFRADVSSLAHLHSKLLDVFRNYRLPENICIKYKDDEDEWVTCETEEEWQEMLQMLHAQLEQSEVLQVAICDVPLWEKVPTYVEVFDTVNAQIAELSEALKKAFNEENEAKFKSTLADVVNTIKTTISSMYNHGSPAQAQEEQQQQPEQKQQPREYTLDIDFSTDIPVKVYPGAPQPSSSSSTAAASSSLFSEIKSAEAVADAVAAPIVSSSLPENDEAARILREALNPAKPEDDAESLESLENDRELDNEHAGEDWIMVQENNQGASQIQARAPEPVAAEPVQEEDIPDPDPEQPVDEQPVQPEPIVEQPVQPEPVQPEPVQPEPVVEQPAQPEPVVEQPVQPEPVQPEPEAPQQPKYAAQFIDDITVRDGMVFPPNTPFIKTWRIRNTGSAQWPQGVQLKFFYGDNLQAPQYTPVKPVLPGEDVDISVRLVTPGNSGNYKAFFRLVVANDEPFGHKVWVNPVVLSPPAQQPQPQQPMYPQPHPYPQVYQQPPQHAPMYPQPPPQPQRSKWHDKLQSLHDMGFTNDTVNINLLEKHNGDLPRVIHHLLGF